MFCSSKRTVLPSAAMPLGKDQLSHVRLRSPFSPAEKPTISRREEFTEQSTRPSRAMSRRNPPGRFQICRVLPDSEVAEMLWRPLDQTSAPRGDYASQELAYGPVNRTLPSVSTTFTLPLLSPRNGWSMKATSRPSGETRRSLVQPGASYNTFPIG